MAKSEQANQGIVITTGGCTNDAMGYASENVGNELIDGAKLEELTKTHIGSSFFAIIQKSVPYYAQ